MSGRRSVFRNRIARLTSSRSHRWSSRRPRSSTWRSPCARHALPRLARRH